MKYAIIIIDGAADKPLEALGGTTPLEACQTPVLDSLAVSGKVGLTHNVPANLAPGSDVAILSLLGYDVADCYTGRAPLEAAAQGIEFAESDWVFRTNLVTLLDGLMADYCAGHIPTEQGVQLIDAMNEAVAQAGIEGVQFHHGISYRHTMVCTQPMNVTCTPPHDITDTPYEPHWPKGQGADLLKDLIELSRKAFLAHPVNCFRRDKSLRAANSIWFWGEGQKPNLERFADRFGVSAAAITAVDLVRGIARLTGMDIIDVPGATGFIDTNYVGKGESGAAALDDHDLVIIHVEAPDECGHNAMAVEKAQSLTDIDQHVIAPVLDRLQREDEWRIWVSPDHPTPCALKTHTMDPVPFVLAGSNIDANGATRLTETQAQQTGLDIEKGCELMEQFIVRT
jgi:2,3-bisphosphoglycerate-independent phosphoglycerate mutase